MTNVVIGGLRMPKLQSLFEVFPIQFDMFSLFEKDHSVLKLSIKKVH